MASKEKGKQRFAQVSDENIKKLTEKYVVANTQRSTRWAVNNFEEWRRARNARSGSNDICPEDLLQQADTAELNKWLTRYVAETRHEDGEPYPPKTLQGLLSGFLRHIRENGDSEAPNFLQKNDTRFKDLHNALDNVYRQLNSDGVGLATKKTLTLADADMNLLWEKGIIGKHAPTPLLRAVFFTLGMHACLRGGEEHRQLTFSMLTRGPDSWIYLEPSSKNRPGGASALNIQRKEVTIYSAPEEGDRCPVSILDCYMEHVPPTAIQNNVCFYLKPLSGTVGNIEKPWYANQPVGKHTLNSMVKVCCEEAGIKGMTNHSLRATGATKMFTAGVPEKVIQERTGHRSLEGLRQYEKTSIKQHIAATHVVASNSSKPFADIINLAPGPAEQQQKPATGQYSFENCTVNFYQVPSMTYAMKREPTNDHSGISATKRSYVPPPPSLYELDEDLHNLFESIPDVY